MSLELYQKEYLEGKKRLFKIGNYKDVEFKAESYYIAPGIRIQVFSKPNFEGSSKFLDGPKTSNSGLFILVPSKSGKTGMYEDYVKSIRVFNKPEKFTQANNNNNYLIVLLVVLFIFIYNRK